MDNIFDIAHDLEYLAIFTVVLFLPKILLKLKIPSGISALFLGIGIGFLDPTIQDDELYKFLAQIGITSLFVFSGLEVEFEEFTQNRKYFINYLSKSMIILTVITFALYDFMNLELQTAFLLALGIFTPSAGFIINSLHSYKLGEDSEYWVKSKAISREIISIVLMFVALQFSDVKQMVFSSLFFLGLFLILPKLFKLFFKYISPIAPNSEVLFLVTLSLIAGVISKALGAYYLVGAFIVGLVGASFKKDIFKENEEVIFTSLSSFFTVFLPFYFFLAGTKLSFAGFSMDAIILGTVFVVIFVPLRLASTNTSMKLFLGQLKEKPYAISLSLMPTLIFGLVIAGVLNERSLATPKIIYALIFYTLVTSLIPTIVFAIQKYLKKENHVEQ